MNQRVHDQEFQALVDKWTEAEDARQQLVDRLRGADGPPVLEDPIWDEWDVADEMAGSAREAVRSFLAADGHDRLP